MPNNSNLFLFFLRRIIEVTLSAMEYHVAESQVNTVLMLSVAAAMPTISHLASQCELDLGSQLYRRLLITRTFRGNRKRFRLSGVQVTRS